jgi:hypothetical protein
MDYWIKRFYRHVLLGHGWLLVDYTIGGHPIVDISIGYGPFEDTDKGV